MGGDRGRPMGSKAPGARRDMRNSISAILPDETAATRQAVDMAVQMYDMAPTITPPTSCDGNAIKLFVGNIPKHMGDAEVHRVFGSMGALARVTLNRYGNSTKSKGSALVWFKRRQDAMNAMLNLHGQMRLPKRDHSLGPALTVRPATRVASPERSQDTASPSKATSIGAETASQACTDKAPSSPEELSPPQPAPLTDEQDQHIVAIQVELLETQRLIRVWQVQKQFSMSVETRPSTEGTQMQTATTSSMDTGSRGLFEASACPSWRPPVCASLSDDQMLRKLLRGTHARHSDVSASGQSAEAGASWRAEARAAHPHPLYPMPAAMQRQQTDPPSMPAATPAAPDIFPALWAFQGGAAATVPTPAADAMAAGGHPEQQAWSSPVVPLSASFVSASRLSNYLGMSKASRSDGSCGLSFSSGTCTLSDCPDISSYTFPPSVPSSKSLQQQQARSGAQMGLSLAHLQQQRMLMQHAIQQQMVEPSDEEGAQPQQQQQRLQAPLSLSQQQQQQQLQMQEQQQLHLQQLLQAPLSLSQQQQQHQQQQQLLQLQEQQQLQLQQLLQAPLSVSQQQQQQQQHLQLQEQQQLQLQQLLRQGHQSPSQHLPQQRAQEPQGQPDLSQQQLQPPDPQWRGHPSPSAQQQLFHPPLSPARPQVRTWDSESLLRQSTADCTAGSVPRQDASSQHLSGKDAWDGLDDASQVINQLVAHISSLAGKDTHEV